MIARVWHARTDGPQATEAYHQVFETEVLPGLRRVDGFHGAYLLAHQGGGPVRITTLTLFTSLATIRHFAGDDLEREHVTPAARATLLDSAPAVRHLDVLTAFPPV